MKNPLSRPDHPESAPAAALVGDHADRLGGIARLPHDEDERPSREDRGYGQTIFSRPPVPLPRFLKGPRKR